MFLNNASSPLTVLSFASTRQNLATNHYTCRLTVSNIPIVHIWWWWCDCISSDMLLPLPFYCAKFSLLITFSDRNAYSDTNATVFLATCYYPYMLTVSNLVHCSHSVTRCDRISGNMLLYTQICYTKSSPLFTPSDKMRLYFWRHVTAHTHLLY